MTRDVVIPGAVAADDNLVILFVPKAGLADPSSPTVAEVTAGTVKDITYDLTPTGFNHTHTEEDIEDDRLTLRDALTLAGRERHDLELQYVFGADDTIADAALAKGTEGFIVARYAVPYETDFTAAQIVDIFTVQAGAQRKDAPTANGRWTKTQRLRQRGRFREDVPLGAGA
jgi:hypothetical protein